MTQLNWWPDSLQPIYGQWNQPIYIDIQIKLKYCTRAWTNTKINLWEHEMNQVEVTWHRSNKINRHKHVESKTKGRQINRICQKMYVVQVFETLTTQKNQVREHRASQSSVFWCLCWCWCLYSSVVCQENMICLWLPHGAHDADCMSIKWWYRVRRLLLSFLFLS